MTKTTKRPRFRCSRPRLWKTSLERSWDQDSSFKNHNCVCYTQYTPPTPTRLHCRVELRRHRRCVLGITHWPLWLQVFPTWSCRLLD